MLNLDGCLLFCLFTIPLASQPERLNDFNRQQGTGVVSDIITQKVNFLYEKVCYQTGTKIMVEQNLIRLAQLTGSVAHFKIFTSRLLQLSLAYLNGKWDIYSNWRMMQMTLPWMSTLSGLV